MKITRLILLSFSFFFISMISAKAQTLTPQQQEYEKNKVQIFTVNERDNLFNWFGERAKLMNLSEEKEDEYTGVLLFYFVKMGRLDDKDKGNSKEEIIQKMDKLLKKQDTEIREVLTNEEYEIHHKNYDKLVNSIKTRIAETDYSSN